MRLTGLDAQENQARRLLNDLTAYRARLNRTTTTPISDTAAAGRWLSEAFEPAVAAVPAELRPKRAAAQLFHELLEHRWFLSERAGKDVGMEAATASYVDNVLPPPRRPTRRPRSWHRATTAREAEYPAVQTRSIEEVHRQTHPWRAHQTSGFALGF